MGGVWVRGIVVRASRSRERPEWSACGENRESSILAILWGVGNAAGFAGNREEWRPAARFPEMFEIPRYLRSDRLGSRELVLAPLAEATYVARTFVAFV